MPFHIFVHEKELSVYNKDREKRKILIDEYQYIVERLEKLYKMEEIGEIEFQCIVTSMREVLRLLAKNYKQIAFQTKNCRRSSRSVGFRFRAGKRD